MLVSISSSSFLLAARPIPAHHLAGTARMIAPAGASFFGNSASSLCLTAFKQEKLNGLFKQIEKEKISLGLHGSDRAQSIENVIANHTSGEVRVTYDPNLDTIIRHSHRGRIPDARPMGPGARLNSDAIPPQALVPMFAGAGGRSSHSGSLELSVELLNAANAIPGTYEEGETGKGFKRKLQAMRDYIPVAAEAVDYPSQLHGPEAEKFRTLDEALEWFDRYFDSLKQLAPGLPIIPVARSAAVGLLIAYNAKYPGRLSGLIALGPLHPTIGFEESTEALFDSAINNPNFSLQIETFQWVKTAYEQMDWQDAENPLGDMPIMTIFGRDDPQVTPAVRDAFVRLANVQNDHHYARGLAFDDIDFDETGGLSSVEVVSGGHFLLGSRTNPEKAKVTYEKIYEFLNRVVGYQNLRRQSDLRGVSASMLGG